MKTAEIHPANRIQQVEEYYFSSKLRAIREMNQAGEPVINLGIGNPDGLPDEKVLGSLTDSVNEPGNHGYQPYSGTSELKTAFAGWYQRYYSVELNPDTEILPLIGSKEGIMHISLAFLNPGDEVLVPDPGYPAYQSVTRLVGAKPISYDLSESSDWKPDLAVLSQINLEAVKLMWVNYPNMPTGQSADADFFEELIDFGNRHNILIVNDNPYSFILNDHPQSILATPGAQTCAIELNSLSKSHNMAGWRIGVVSGAKQFIQYILRVKSNMDSGMFKPLQLAAVKALDLDSSWYERNNKRYIERRKLIWQLFDVLDCRYNPNQQGMFVWAKIPDEIPDAKALSEDILQNARVFITPGFIFGSNGERYLRASLCQPESIIQAAIKRILETR